MNFSDKTDYDLHSMLNTLYGRLRILTQSGGNFDHTNIIHQCENMITMVELELEDRLWKQSDDKPGEVAVIGEEDKDDKKS